ncbi:unnamed protein product [Rotaria sp. Silwood1]|nr:unnamed protein product [Rotaria sp. Silwood1]CAF5010287.1 unnamed protein product [Rotaria sp. Silwood1]
MDDDEFDQVPQILFENVTSLSKIGTPGTLIPMTQDTRAVLCGDDSNNVLVVATRFRNGRCLVFAHNGYPAIFLNNDTKNQHFVDNCRRWLSQGKDAQFESIDSIESMDSVKEKGTILVWNGHNNKSDPFMDDLRGFLQEGGALVCAATAWGWLQRYKGKVLSDFPFACFCDSLGVKLTDNCGRSPDPIPFRPEMIKFKNVCNAAQVLTSEPNNVEYMAIVGSTIKELNDTLPDSLIETVQNMILNAESDVIPTKTSPIKDQSCRQRSVGLCDMMCGLCNTKAPGINEFPGDFDDTPSMETDVTVNIQSKNSEWYCTGYYVAAGTTMQIDVSEQVGATGWSARIGCHSDDLGKCDQLRRWHCISSRKPLSGTTIKMSSAFGGLLFLESPTGESNSISVNLQNVVLTPIYDLMDSNREEHWEDLRVRAQGLWADIAGQYIVFNLPSKIVRDLNSDQLDRALRFWDTVVLTHHELRGTTPVRRERIVCDEQPSAGYMHAGYPVVTHLDVTNPEAEHFLMNSDNLEKNGSWGLFHEIGHNMQRDWWTFSFAREITTNIFTLHAMDAICHLEPWIHSWLKDQIEKTKESIKKGTPFNEWKTNAGFGLFIYAQLAREFGWDSYKAVFRQYEQTKPTLNNDQEKIDHWITTFSRQVEHNLVPLFKFWGFPISQSTIAGLGDLPVREMSDELIEIAPERYQV